MTKTYPSFALALLVGCSTHLAGKAGSDAAVEHDGTEGSGDGTPQGPDREDGGVASGGDGSEGGDGSADGANGDGASGDDGGAPPAPDLVADVLARLGACQQVSAGLFATDSESQPTIPVCGLQGALFWKADMDVDCDGERTDVCNETTDPWYQNQTSGQASSGAWLDASQLPYVVIPSPSDRLNYENEGIDIGAVVAVIYQGKLAFGVFGDSGPREIIGEASYAMAVELGINPDPANGGTADEVVYIAFQGEEARVSPLEDHAATVELGTRLLEQLVQSNP